MRRTYYLLGLIIVFLAACSGEPKAPAGRGIIDITPQQLTEAQKQQICGDIAYSDCEVIKPYIVDFTLTDHFGQVRQDEDFAGKVMFIYFGYASCPDICPAALSVMSATLNELGNKADDVQALFITIDPERDTSELLKAHLSFDDRILGLTGSLDQAAAARKGVKAYAQRYEMPESALGYAMEHQDFFYITDKQGTPLYIVDGSQPPQRVANVISYALKQ